MTNEQIGLLALVCFLFIIVIPLTLGIIETVKIVKATRRETSNINNDQGNHFATLRKSKQTN